MNNKDLIKLIFCGIIGILLIIIMYHIYPIIFYNDTPEGFGCFYENGILLNQYIDNDYLYMKVYSEKIGFFRCGHIKSIEWTNRTFYFEKEKELRNDLKENDSITIKWCYIPNIETCNKDTLEGCHRIREIKKQ